MRVCIAGGPKVGKTTLAVHLHDVILPVMTLPVLHSDEVVLDRGWSEQSDTIVEWLNKDAPWIIEGVPVLRALRKWLKANPEGKPCDVLYWRTQPFTERTRGQETLATQCQKQYDAIVPELRRRGVELRTF